MQHSTLAVSEAWIGVIGALGGVTLTSVIALATALLNHRWTAEEAREQRHYETAFKRAEVRRTAYVRLLSASDNVRDAAEAYEVPPGGTDITTWYRDRPDLLREVQAADNGAKLVAGDAAYAKLDAFGEALVDYVNDLFDQAKGDDVDDTRVWGANEELLTAIREEQAVDLAS